MPTSPVGVTDTAPAAGVAEIAAVSRADMNVTTTTTADPGTGGTSLAVTDRTFGSRVPTTAANYLIDVVGTSGIAERMLVTGGGGAGAGSLTVTRAQEGTAAVAHSIGAKVAIVVRVQQVEPIDGSKQVAYKGRACTFRTPGRAGTAGQKLFALHNATGSTVNVDISKIVIDCAQTVVKLVTVLPPVVKAVRFTTAPSGGTTLVRTPEDTSLSSKTTAVTIWGDASADGTPSGTALTIGSIVTNIQAGVLQHAFAPRYMVHVAPTASSINPLFEPFDTIIFFDGEDETITLRELEGVCIFLDYTATGQNPTTDMWTVSARWQEWTPS
jgi:hypothetical protein